MRVKLSTVPDMPECSLHDISPKPEHVFVIHTRGKKEHAQYLCVHCQREVLERLLIDWLTFPGLRKEMGEISLPKGVVESFVNTLSAEVVLTTSVPVVL
jgi:hypothetical protein